MLFTTVFKLKSFFILGAVAFFSFIVWVIYLADMGGRTWFAHIVNAVPYGDKVGHFCLFGLLTLALNMALFGKTLNLVQRPVYLGTLLVGSFAFLEELSQYFIASRTLDYRDLVADALGIAFFSFVSYKLLLFIKQN